MVIFLIPVLKLDKKVVSQKNLFEDFSGSPNCTKINLNYNIILKKSEKARQII